MSNGCLSSRWLRFRPVVALMRAVRSVVGVSIIWKSAVPLTFMLLLSAVAGAQQDSGIAGLVTDTTGGVLPGVTVEVSSPALIEGVRTAVTDGQGRYNTIGLLPGTYVVTFSLPGFNTIRREGIELTSGFTAPVSVQMPVGGLEETVTVTGASPLVDVQNVRQQAVVSAELLSALPTSTRSLSTLITLVPAMNGIPDSGGASGIYRSNAPRLNTVHAKDGMKFLFDGMKANSLGAAGATAYVLNPAMGVETVVEIGGVSAESNASGFLMNMIPKDGANTFNSIVSGLYNGESLQSDNLTDELRDRGVVSVNDILHLYDFNATLGGPIKRDRLWFFTATRFAGNKNQVAGVFANATPDTLLYTPDLDRPADRREHLKSIGGRVTWQASQRNKVSFFTDVQSMALKGRGDFVSPEALTGFLFWPNVLSQVSWTMPATNRLLLEAGYSLMHTSFPWFAVGGPNDISIRNASTGFRYNATASFNETKMDVNSQRFSVSYVTGSHAFKVGTQIEENTFSRLDRTTLDQRYTFLGDRPLRIEQLATPFLAKANMFDLSFFAQDQWVIKRLTLNYGVRFDHFGGRVPAQQLAATQFVPVARDFDEVRDVPNWKDVNPRLGAAYDLFGNGRTALKVSLGRYVSAHGSDVTSPADPIRTAVNTVNRTWDDTNGDFVPDCDLLNNFANGECGQISNLNFGGTRPSTQFSDDLLTGFGNRPYFWDFTVEVQQEVMSGLSVTAGYYRNWTDHFSRVLGFYTAGVTDNILVTPADYSPYCITAPADPRLPGGGSYEVCGLNDIAPAQFGRVENLRTRAENVGGEDSRYSDFFGFTFDARLVSGALFGGGVDLGRTVTDRCYVIDSPQALLYCHVETPFSAQTQVKLHGSYPLPGDFSLSATFLNTAGPVINANYAATNAEIAPSLGRNLAACRGAAVCSATARVPLVAPQTLFENRRTQLDLRFSKIFSVSQRARLRASLDIYNVLNASAVLDVNDTFGPRWQFPVGGTGGADAILWGRFIQLGGELSF